MTQQQTHQEVWNLIPGYGHYAASSMGRVRSLDHYVTVNGHQQWMRGRILRPNSNNTSKRPTVCMPAGEGKWRSVFVHKLVLLAFRGNRPKGTTASHLNGDKNDNRIVNLLWESQKDNAYRRREHGTHPAGEKCGKAKLTQKQVDKIRELYSAGGITKASISRMYGVSSTQIGTIIARENWK